MMHCEVSTHAPDALTRLRCCMRQFKPRRMGFIANRPFIDCAKGTTEELLEALRWEFPGEPCSVTEHHANPWESST